MDNMKISKVGIIQYSMKSQSFNIVLKSPNNQTNKTLNQLNEKVLTENQIDSEGNKNKKQLHKLKS